MKSNNTLTQTCTDLHNTYIETQGHKFDLQTLIDRATPKVPDRGGNSETHANGWQIRICSYCCDIVGQNLGDGWEVALYCPTCGQAQQWDGIIDQEPSEEEKGAQSESTTN